MEKNVKTAFTYFLSDPEWKYKFTILSMLYFPSAFFFYVCNPKVSSILHYPSSLVIMLLIAMFALFAATSFFAFGYGAKCIQNVIFADENTTDILPKWEDNSLTFLNIAFKKSMAILFIGLALIPGIILLAIPILIFNLIYLALDNIFSRNFDMKSYFAWKKAFAIIKSDFGQYVQVFFISIAMSIASSILTNLSSSIPILVVIIPIYFAYMLLVNAYLIGILGHNYQDEDSLMNEDEF